MHLNVSSFATFTLLYYDLFANFCFLPFYHTQLYFSTLLVIVSSASKWYDGPSRPYEFGYKLENNQHRFEKKGKCFDDDLK